MSYSLAVADFDNDSNPNIVVANENRPSTVSIYLGNGDGTFADFDRLADYGLQHVRGDRRFHRRRKADIAIIDNPKNGQLVSLENCAF